MHRFPLYDILVDHPVATRLRRGLVPKGVRTKIRQFFSMRQRPALTAAARRELEGIFDKDLAILGGWLGRSLPAAILVR